MSVSSSPPNATPSKLSSTGKSKELSLSAKDHAYDSSGPKSAVSTIPDPAGSNGQQQTQKSSLTFPGVADLFVRLRRHRKASTTSTPSNAAPGTDAPLTKAHHIVSTSGPEPISHPRVLEEVPDSAHITPPATPQLSTTPLKSDKENVPRTPQKRRISSASIPFPSPSSKRRSGTVSLDELHLEKNDTFVCSDAVNVPVLLSAMRRELKDKASTLGANALANEQWSCTICGPKHRRDGSFRVNIRYSASPVRSKASDPNKPVCLDKAKGVPGLMTVLKRTAAA